MNIPFINFSSLHFLCILSLLATILTNDEDLRLPTAIKPVDYDLHIIPDHQNSRFDGQVTIRVLVKEATNTIKLHSFKLRIKSVKVIKSGKSFPIKKSFLEPKKQFFTIHLKNKLKLGEYLVKISFAGLLNGTVGYFKATFENNNKTSQYSATKFEPTYARQAFPCFDEPNFKATIKMTITHDKDLVALANMPMDKEIEYKNKKVTTFIRSPVKMSTYLIAWTVGDFKHKKGLATDSKESQIRIFAPPNQVNLTKYGLNTTIKILDFFEKFFDIRYPLPKLDLIAFPNFPAGAMEHWGLIAHRDKILVDPKTTSADGMKKSGRSIAHELSHNWFGNLVTMNWWNDLWLNEGFAEYIQYKGLAAAEPDWGIEDHIIIDRLDKVMTLDALSTTHPIVQEVKNPDQINEIFDDISYDKGASVIRMLEDTIGTETFKTGIRKYLNKYKEDNAKASYLWTEMNQALNQSASPIKNITEFMDKWTMDKNYPLVSVERKHGEGLLVKQSRFLTQANGDNFDKKPWIIPIRVITERGHRDLFILEKNEDVIKIDIENDEWFKLNPNQTGFYVVNYTTNDWQLLIKLMLLKPELGPIDRANLIMDSFRLAKAGKLDYAVPFDLIKYLKNEDHLIPWTIAANSLTKLIDMTSGNDLTSYLQDLMKDLSKNIYQKLGWEFGENDSLNKRILRSKIVDLACHCGNEDCLNEANRLLVQRIDQEVEFNSDVQDTVFKYGLQQSRGKKEWEWVFRKYLKESVSVEKNRLLVALASVRDTELLQRMIDHVYDGQKLSKSVVRVLSTVANNEIGRPMVWQFIQKHWPKLVEMFTLNNRDLGLFVGKVVGQFDQKWRLEQVEKFFRQNPEAGAGANARKQALDMIKNNIEWLGKNAQSVSGWLREHTKLGQKYLAVELDDDNAY